MPFFVIALGMLVIYFAPGLARQNTAFFKHTYRFPVPFPKIWSPFFRLGGLLLILAGAAMLLGVGVKAR
ncbi:MAG TPA: hypothetical protein VMI54_17920 [Polyangiaceae bacterium]|nr:hypothetical protein [Polyangiaceae bacterium]